MKVYQVEASGNLNAFGELSQRPHVITLPWISIFKGVQGFEDIHPIEYIPLPPAKRPKPKAKPEPKKVCRRRHRLPDSTRKAIIQALKKCNGERGSVKMIAEQFGVSQAIVSIYKRHMNCIREAKSFSAVQVLKRSS